MSAETASEFWRQQKGIRSFCKSDTGSEPLTELLRFNISVRGSDPLYPEIEIYNDHTKVILFAHKEYAQMSKEDRYRACYLHACLKRVNRDYMTNASLRERFNIDKKNSSMVSRLLNETCALGLVYVSPDSTSDKNRKYLPFWA